MDQNVAQIIDAFGGTSALAKLCEIAPSAVSQWKAKNHIPRQQVKFLRLQRPDLFPVPPDEIQGGEVRAQ